MIESLDHLVLTVADIQTSVDFYTSVLGMKHVVFGEGRTALSFGGQKLNLHQHKKELNPKAKHPTPGSADLCFVAATRLDEIIDRLNRLRVPIEEGPAPRTGAVGPITSIYIRDPDGNLIEICEYPKETV